MGQGSEHENRRPDKASAAPPRVPPHPGASTPAISRRMSRARRRDTAPELQLRSILHRSGLRYRVAYPLPGNRRRSIDIAFPRVRLAVFVDGCFWHGCPEHGTQPRSNETWWATKLAANRARDLDTNELLARAGWTVIRIWEHEDPALAATRVTAAHSELASGPIPTG